MWMLGANHQTELRDPGGQAGRRTGDLGGEEEVCYFLKESVGLIMKIIYYRVEYKLLSTI